MVLGGVIDEDFHGTIEILLINHGTQPYKVEMFSKIAQLLIVKVHQLDAWYRGKDEVTRKKLESAEYVRGTRGFGSTGK